jgi:Protein of unknown function (DUF3047)
VNRRRWVVLTVIVLAAATLPFLARQVTQAPAPRAMPQAAARNNGGLAAPSEGLKTELINVVTGERADGLVTDSAGRLQIPIGEALTRPSAGGLPPGWQLQTFSGQPSFEPVRSEMGQVFRLKAAASSFALYRGVVVDLDDLPLLSWVWNVARLPSAGDARQASTDDQAAQVYVIFPRWPGPRANSEVIGYIWDTTAPVGTRLVSPKASNVRLIVVESGSQSVGSWRRYRRNVRDDYVAMFGRRPPRVGSIAIMSDADDTGGATEALVGDLAFSRP